MTGARATALGAVAVLAAAAPPAHAARAPLIDQLVVTVSGRGYVDTVRARETTVRVGRRRCAVPQGTPLAALARAELPRLALRDFGSCSARPRDAAGLFVAGIGRDRNRGRDGWVYKVANRQGTAGAADPSGPFGRGPLRRRSRITWFYCRFDERARSCQRTLVLRARPQPDGTVAVRVLAYDDAGRAVPAGGATVRAAGTTTTTDSTGLARLSLPPGRHRLRAEQAGAVRSFDEVVTVAP